MSGHKAVGFNLKRLPYVNESAAAVKVLAEYASFNWL